MKPVSKTKTRTNITNAKMLVQKKFGLGNKFYAEGLDDFGNVSRNLKVN